MNPVIVLGGTFDPPHHGHLALLQAAGNALAMVDRRFLIAADPWQKTGVTPAKHRVAMLELAVGALDTQDSRVGAQRLSIDTRELARHATTGEPSYTIDSLRELRAELGAHTTLTFVLGWDQWLALPSWHEWRSLLDVAHLCVAPRVQAFGSVSAELEEWSRFKFASAHALREAPAGLVFQLPQFEQAVSSSDLRAALGGAQAGDVDLWLEPAVLRYIAENRLYR